MQELFQEKFRAERLPHRNCVSALLDKFKKTGSVQDKPNTGRPKPQDSEKRVLFCRWFENFILEKGENILNHTFFSDEAWFHLSGYMNSQNSKCCLQKIPMLCFRSHSTIRKLVFLFGVLCQASIALLLN